MHHKSWKVAKIEWKATPYRPEHVEYHVLPVESHNQFDSVFHSSNKDEATGVMKFCNAHPDIFYCESFA